MELTAAHKQTAPVSTGGNVQGGGVLQEHPIYLEQADLDYIAGFDLVHTTNNGFVDSLLPQLSQLPPFVSYDFSYRWNEEDRVERVCPYIDFAFLSCSGLDDVQTQDLCRRLHEKGCGMVTATRGSTVIKMTVGQTNFTVNGQTKTLDVAPRIIGGRTVVPVRAIAEGFGANVGWNGDARIVSIRE